MASWGRTRLAAVGDGVFGGVAAQVTAARVFAWTISSCSSEAGGALGFAHELFGLGLDDEIRFVGIVG